MEKLLEIRPVEGKEPILIEATEVEYQSGVVQAGGGKLSFEEMLQKVKPFCESILLLLLLKMLLSRIYYASTNNFAFF